MHILIDDNIQSEKFKAVFTVIRVDKLLGTLENALANVLDLTIEMISFEAGIHIGLKVLHQSSKVDHISRFIFPKSIRILLYRIIRQMNERITIVESELL